MNKGYFGLVFVILIVGGSTFFAARQQIQGVAARPSLATATPGAGILAPVRDVARATAVPPTETPAPDYRATELAISQTQTALEVTKSANESAGAAAVQTQTNQAVVADNQRHSEALAKIEADKAVAQQAIQKGVSDNDRSVRLAELEAQADARRWETLKWGLAVLFGVVVLRSLRWWYDQQPKKPQYQPKPAASEISQVENDGCPVDHETICAIAQICLPSATWRGNLLNCSEANLTGAGKPLVKDADFDEFVAWGVTMGYLHKTGPAVNATHAWTDDGALWLKKHYPIPSPSVSPSPK